MIVFIIIYNRKKITTLTIVNDLLINAFDKVLRTLSRVGLLLFCTTPATPLSLLFVHVGKDGNVVVVPLISVSVTVGGDAFILLSSPLVLFVMVDLLLVVVVVVVVVLLLTCSGPLFL